MRLQVEFNCVRDVCARVELILTFRHDVVCSVEGARVRGSTHSFGQIVSKEYAQKEYTTAKCTEANLYCGPFLRCESGVHFEFALCKRILLVDAFCQLEVESSYLVTGEVRRKLHID